MDDYEIVEWPDIQELMGLEGFSENATLIEPNESLGIGSSTYLVKKSFLYLEKCDLYVCTECGSDNIEVKVWIDPNTDHVVEWCEDEEDTCWCYECQKIGKYKIIRNGN